MNEFWTSDPHFGHKNIIKHCARPFRTADGQLDVHAMNRTLTERWNSVVGPRDTVFCLGDFSMEKVDKVREYRRKLHGKIVLVRGNHDRNAQQMLQAGFEEVHDNLTIVRDGLTIYMSHIPIFDDEPEARELIPGQKKRRYSKELVQKPPPFFHHFLCGHVHEKWKRRGKITNVGVDQWDFTPRTLKELLP